jgi:hypothetical protein
MSIVMQMRWPEVTPQQYDQVREIVGWEQNPDPAGRLHVAWFQADGLHVWDVWDSEEAFGRFTQDRLMPGVQKIGVAGQPEVTMVRLHAYQKEDVDPTGGVVVGGTIPSADAYDAMASTVDWAGVPPIGGVCHIAAVAADGSIQSVDVWTSAEANAAFVSGRLAEGAASLGIPAETRPDFTETHLVYAVFHPDGPRSPR